MHQVLPESLGFFKYLDHVTSHPYQIHETLTSPVVGSLTSRLKFLQTEGELLKLYEGSRNALQQLE